VYYPVHKLNAMVHYQQNKASEMHQTAVLIHPILHNTVNFLVKKETIVVGKNQINQCLTAIKKSMFCVNQSCRAGSGAGAYKG
jgi:hypothetical protein